MKILVRDERLTAFEEGNQETLETFLQSGGSKVTPTAHFTKDAASGSTLKAKPVGCKRP
ncbi:hypothetical protein PI126_g15613 [Phytophthora idaei]|nr:hypothetical protein PI126_g15613 [Phytophthora idaei]